MRMGTFREAAVNLSIVFAGIILGRLFGIGGLLIMALVYGAYRLVKHLLAKKDKDPVDVNTGP